MWKSSKPFLVILYTEIETNQGQTIRQLAKKLSVAPSTILRQLPNMDNHHLFLYQDSSNKLYTFKGK